MTTTRVLIVDDNDLQRDVLADILASEGYAVQVAATGAEALAAARAAPPDVVLLDLMLPDIDGASLLAELRAEPALAMVHVVITTGVRASSMRRLPGVDAVLFKPFDLRELVTTVASVVGTGASAEPVHP